MTQLALSIKQNFFDDILSGKKKNEIREIRPRSTTRYCELDEEGNLIGPRHYDTLKLITGQFKGERPYLIVKVKSIMITFWDDEETNEPIILEEDGITYEAASIEYKLGNIVSTFKCQLQKDFAK